MLLKRHSPSWPCLLLPWEPPVSVLEEQRNGKIRLFPWKNQLAISVTVERETLHRRRTVSRTAGDHGLPWVPSAEWCEGSCQSCPAYRMFRIKWGEDSHSTLTNKTWWTLKWQQPVLIFCGFCIVLLAERYLVALQSTKNLSSSHEERVSHCTSSVVQCLNRTLSITEWEERNWLSCMWCKHRRSLQGELAHDSHTQVVCHVCWLCREAALAERCS